MNARFNQLRPTLLVGAGIVVGIFMVLAWGALGSTAQGASSQTVSAQAGCQTFRETGHKVCGRFLDYWNTHGGLAQQGYPLSEEFIETSALNGRPYTVQYFERAVFEKHPENKPPFDVLLSQLGTFLGNGKYTQGFPAAAGETPFYEDRTDPVAALLSYYNAINRKDYERAYSYFQGAPNPDPSLAAPFAQFVQGYANTASVTVAVGKVFIDAGAGQRYATFPVVLTARNANGSTQLFAGCYTLHRVAEGISENPNDELWSINSAKLSVVAADSSLDRLLTQNCVR
jgi:hypothetical protein